MNTTLGGALKTRVMTSIGSAGGVAGLSSTAVLLLLPLQFGQVAIQPIEALLPETVKRLSVVSTLPFQTGTVAVI